MPLNYKQNLSPDNLRKMAATFTFAGSPGYIFCFFAHICMAGHMQHPPYPTWHFISDYIWLISFIFAAITAVSSNLPRRYLFAILILFLCLSRITGSMGGGGSLIFELPVLIFLIIKSVREFAKRAAG